jgi:hypothetical protein
MSSTLTLIVMFALGAFVGSGLTIMITYATTARAINTISRTSRSAEKALHIASEIIKDNNIVSHTTHTNNQYTTGGIHNDTVQNEQKRSF